MMYIILSIAVALLIIGFLLYRSYGKEKNKEKAYKFLQDFYNLLFTQAIDLIHNNADIFKNMDIKEIKTKTAEMVYDSSWKFIENQKKECEDELSKAVLNVLSKEFVDNFIQTVIYAANTYIDTHYGNVESVDDFNARVESEDKKLQEIFGNSDQYIECIELEEDSNIGLEPEKEGTHYEAKDNGDTVLENNPVEESTVETKADESIEEIGEDGLTDAEREAGVHFDKNGRKRNKNGRYVK